MYLDFIEIDMDKFFFYVMKKKLGEKEKVI